MKRQFHVMATPQRGAVLPLVIIGLVVIIGMAGLALDLGHAYVNKTRLQNALDAAALSGAKNLLSTKDTDQATDAAIKTFNLNLSADGNKELAVSLTSDNVEFSSTLFNPGTEPPRYIRVRLNNFTLPTWLIHVLGDPFDQLTISASSVAGPMTLSCADIVPLIVCGDSSQPNYGYQTDQPYALKVGEKDKDTGWEIAPGNFQFLQLPACGNNSAKCVADQLAGAYNPATCTPLSSGYVTTNPGNKVSVGTGLNTRLGIYETPGFSNADRATYPPDLVTDAGEDPSYPDSLDEYNNDYTTKNYDQTDGREYRRILAVPIGNCAALNGPGGGSVDVPVLTIGCFLLDRPADTAGEKKNCTPPDVDPKDDNGYEFCGRFMALDGEPGCSVQGIAGPGPGTLYKILLYKDPDSGDS